jgi:hypothetical protein
LCYIDAERQEKKTAKAGSAQGSSEPKRKSDGGPAETKPKKKRKNKKKA